MKTTTYTLHVPYMINEDGEVNEDWLNKTARGIWLDTVDALGLTAMGTPHVERDAERQIVKITGEVRV